MLDHLYEAAASPGHWANFLEEIKAEVSANKAYFVLLDPDGRNNLSLQSGFDEQAILSYETYYSQRDVILQGLQQRVAVHGDWVGNTESLVKQEVFRGSEVFNDFSLPNGDIYYCEASFGNTDNELWGGLGLSRSEATGEFQEDVISLLAVLAPHVKRAMGLHRTLGHLRTENADMRCSLESVGLAIISVDGEGRVVRLTGPARKLLNARDGLELDKNRLLASALMERLHLRVLISGAAATGSGKGTNQPVRLEGGFSPQAAAKLWSAPSGGAMLISRRPPKKPLQLVVAPFRSSEIFLEDRPAAMIFVNDPDAVPASRASVLRALYGLSPSECRLTDLLVAGQEISKAAEQLRMSVQTARFHLKAIFQKTATHRQADLVRLVLTLPGVG
ncbi:MAG: hypothetical protein ABI383_11235 [Acidobacteriaceae bacterium]